jgi:hypothetical protein
MRCQSHLAARRRTQVWAQLNLEQRVSSSGCGDIILMPMFCSVLFCRFSSLSGAAWKQLGSPLTSGATWWLSVTPKQAGCAISSSDHTHAVGELWPWTVWAPCAGASHNDQQHCEIELSHTTPLWLVVWLGRGGSPAVDFSCRGLCRGVRALAGLSPTDCMHTDSAALRQLIRQQY